MGGPADADTSVHRRVAVLGGLGVRPMLRLSLPGRRLLAYLALKGHSLSRSAASAELWPDLPEEVGRANLRRALWHLPPDWVTTIGEDLLLEAETDLADAHRSAMRALSGEAISLTEIGVLTEDVLPGWHDEWAVSAHEAFRLLRVQALEAACRSMATQGTFALATQAGAAAVAAEPLRESAVEALIEAHLAQHNRYDAIQCFRGLTNRLNIELGVDPDPDLARKVGSLSLLLQR